MKDIIPWEEINLKGRTSGSFKTKCPNCVHTHSRGKKNQEDLSVDLGIGKAMCHRCEAISSRENDNKKNNYSSVTKNYQLPAQEWKNKTELSSKVVKFFEERGISQATVINCRITQEKKYQPQLKKEVENIVFNFFEGDKIINKKYRSAGKAFTQSKKAKKIFYGINDISGYDEIYIVEGEMDKLALYEIGMKNCISLPSGANDTDDTWENSERYLKHVKRFHIATDCDEKGEAVAEKIAQRLGRWRCDRIRFKNKDANDDLIEGRNVLEKSISKPIPYPVSGTYTVESLQDNILKLYEEGIPKTIYPKKYYFGGFKNVFSTMRGHLVTGTGIPSHGKSEFTDWLVMNLINDYDLKGSWFSPEHHPMELHQTNFISKFHGKPFFKDIEGVPRVTRSEIEAYKEWANERIYLTGPEGDQAPTWDWLLDKFKEQMYSFGIDIFVIDAFNKVLFNGKGNKLDLINECLTKLTSFAQRHNVIIFLIAHPTKMQKNEDGLYNCPSLYDVAGSADFRNQTHDGFTIYRHFQNEAKNIAEGTDFINMKTKFGFQGEIGSKISFNYHKPSGRFYVKGIQYQNEPLVSNTTDQEQMNFQSPSPEGIHFQNQDNEISF